MLKHIKKGLRSLNQLLFPQRARDYRQVFDKIYERGIWNKNRQDIPLSGPGSSLENTREVSALLEQFVADKGINSITDLGCGDLTWMTQTRFFNDKNILYTGIDVAPSLIQRHVQSYPHHQFKNLDITSDDIPTADLYIIRDVIFHLHLDRIQQLFKNIRGKWKYLAITSCSNENNTDSFNASHFSARNLHIAPFSINHQYLISVPEEKFKRLFFIIEHDVFYGG
jgi:hypothetical protein